MSIKQAIPMPVVDFFSNEKDFYYEIPKYQREYAWRTEQWEKLFDDIDENGNGYYLGTTICINISTNDFSDAVFQVIDGQQRLSTLSILFAAIYKQMADINNVEKDEDVTNLLYNLKKSLTSKRTKNGTRLLLQKQNSNDLDYSYLMGSIDLIKSQQKPKNYGNRRIAKCYEYFTKRLNAKTGEELSKKIEELKQLLQKIKNAILVSITVDSYSDAFMMFESLNNRGLPLNAMQLIKNKIIATADAKNYNTDDFNKTWEDILDILGDDYGRQERFLRQYYNAFRSTLNIPFKREGQQQYPLGDVATKSRVLPIYEKLIDNDVTALLENLRKAADKYGELIERDVRNNKSCLKNSLLDLLHVEATPAYILLLNLLINKEKYQLEEDDIKRVVDFLVKFFIRRNLTDTPNTQYLTRIFINQIEKIVNDALVGEAIIEFIQKEMIGVSASAKTFEEKLNSSIYDLNAGMVRFLLCYHAEQSATDEKFRAGFWGQTESGQYVWTIEHILPEGKNLPEEWINMIADGSKQKASEIQDQYCHRIGNLTLTGYNSKLSNFDFMKKRDRKDAEGKFVGYRNGLEMNEDLKDKTSWMADDIRVRSLKLVNIMLEYFKFPNER